MSFGKRKASTQFEFTGYEPLSLLFLPENALLSVFRYCEPTERESLRETCTTLSDLGLRSFEEARIVSRAGSQFVVELLPRLSNLRKLTLFCLTPAILRTLTYHSTLSEIHVTRFSSPDAQTFMELPTFSNVSILRCMDIENVEWALAGLSSLKEFDIQQRARSPELLLTAVNALRRLSFSLDTLKITSPVDVCCSSLLQFFSTCGRAIQSICVVFTSVDMLKMFVETLAVTSLPTLKTLRCESPLWSDFNVIQRLCAAHPHLEFLSVPDSVQFDLSQVITTAPKLRCLETWALSISTENMMQTALCRPALTMIKSLNLTCASSDVIPVAQCLSAYDQLQELWVTPSDLSVLADVIVCSTLQLRAVVLEHMDGVSFPLSQLTYLIASLPNIHRMHIECAIDDDCSALDSGVVSNMKELSMDGMTPEIAGFLLRSCPVVESLLFFNMALDRLFTVLAAYAPATIKILKFWFCSTLPERSDLAVTFSRLAAIEELFVISDFATPLDEFLLDIVAEKLPKLQKLISTRTLLSASALVSFSRRRELFLTKMAVGGFTEPGLAAMVPVSIWTLRELGISAIVPSPQFSPAHLIPLLEHPNRLEFLRFHPTFCTDEEAAALQTVSSEVFVRNVVV